MAVYRPDIPPHAAEVIRHLPPDIKRSVKQALRSLSADLSSGVPLKWELSELWKYKVRRFRIIYDLNRKARIIRIYAVVTGAKFTKNWPAKCAKSFGRNSYRS